MSDSVSASFADHLRNSLSRQQFQSIIRNSNKLGNIKSIDLNNEKFKNLLLMESNSFGLVSGPANTTHHDDENPMSFEVPTIHARQVSNRLRGTTEQIDDTKSGKTVVH